MVLVREAFAEGLAEKGALVSATMRYADEGRQQVLTFVIQQPNGVTRTLIETVAANTDLMAHARKMGAAFVAA